MKIASHTGEIFDARLVVSCSTRVVDAKRLGGVYGVGARLARVAIRR